MYRKEVAIGFVLINCLLQHGLEEFVDNFNQVVLLQMVWRKKHMGEAKKGRQIFEHFILQMFSMIQNQLLGDPEMSDDIIEEELGANDHCGV